MEVRSMPKGDKYIALTQYLRNCGKDELTLSFKQVEVIVGEELPPSAKNPAQPSNWSNSTASPSLCHGWLNAGYIAQADIRKQYVTFTKGELYRVIEDVKVKKDKKIQTQENFRKNLYDLSKNLNCYLKKTIGIGNEFGGPSVYFHKRALLEHRSNFLGNEHLEMIYAVVVPKLNLPNFG